MYCLDDGGLCREACVLSYRAKWRQIPDDHASRAARYPARSLWKPAQEIMECTFYNRAAFQRSIAALYERRRVAQQYGCFAEVGLYYLPGEKWMQHDELFYKFGFDVPLPRFLQNEDRAAWLRMPVAELPEHHRATDTITFADRDAVDPELFIIKSLRALSSDGAARGAP